VWGVNLNVDQQLLQDFLHSHANHYYFRAAVILFLNRSREMRWCSKNIFGRETNAFVKRVPIQPNYHHRITRRLPQFRPTTHIAVAGRNCRPTSVNAIRRLVLVVLRE
jgi:hypothetical protein